MAVPHVVVSPTPRGMVGWSVNGFTPEFDLADELPEPFFEPATIFATDYGSHGGAVFDAAVATIPIDSEEDGPGVITIRRDRAGLRWFFNDREFGPSAIPFDPLHPRLPRTFFGRWNGPVTEGEAHLFPVLFIDAWRPAIDGEATAP